MTPNDVSSDTEGLKLKLSGRDVSVCSLLLTSRFDNVIWRDQIVRVKGGHGFAGRNRANLWFSMQPPNIDFDVTVRVG